MSASIEWAALSSHLDHVKAEGTLLDPGECSDGYGTENDELALNVGGCVIEGTLEQWGAFANALMESVTKRAPLETAEQITRRVLDLESLGTWEERLKAAVYLARDEQYRVTESPTQIAERVLENHRIRPDWRRTGEQIVPLLAEAVRIARGEES
uniref:MazG-like nucleotide pyrophosphohydrolase n=1 Tax=Microbacterium phage Judebell TaxID=3230835 RepID=A0AAU8EHQ1_9CAUD